MDVITFARKLAALINEQGYAVNCKAKRVANSWRIVDITADIIIPSATCETPIVDDIRRVGSQNEYLVGKVDIFHVHLSNTNVSRHCYVGPTQNIIDFPSNLLYK